MDWLHAKYSESFWRVKSAPYRLIHNKGDSFLNPAMQDIIRSILLVPQSNEKQFRIVGKSSR